MRQVFVTPKAEKDFDSIVVFIRDKWGEKTANEFIKKADEFFTLLKNYPSIGQVENGDIRGFQLSSQTRVLYRVKEDKIIILAFFDVRRNPDSKPV